jgi:hypothetical protein
MPVTYRLDSGKGVIETRCAGAVTLDEVLRHFRDLEGDPALPARLDVLLDLEQLTSVPESGQLRRVTLEMERLKEQLRFGACAIVASRDVLFGMSRMFEVFASDLFALTHVFRKREEAERWLAGARSQSS